MSAFEYTVTDGDCILSVAQRFGFLWQTIWYANPDLQKLRKNPNVLFPGDIVKIPDRVEKDVPCATDKLHEFVKKGTRAKFRLILERFNVPLSHRSYILDVDGKIYNGQTDDTGLLEVAIDPAARGGRLRLPDDQLEFQLDFGCLDPIDEIKGVQQRLQNLGFLTVTASGEMDDETHYALSAFQSSVDLEPTGELDDTTRSKLFNMQDELHPQSTEDEADPQAESAGPDEAEPGEPETDPDAEAAEMERLLSLEN